MRGLKALLCTTVLALLAPLALAPTAQAQVVISIGGPPPVCPYGYYDYAPYACAPVGFYGPGYFYNGIFLGVGPWYQWGYHHGWGSHRFVDRGGGRYVGSRGRYVPRGYRANRGYVRDRPEVRHNGGGRSYEGPHRDSFHNGGRGREHGGGGHGGGEHGGGEHGGGRR
jgi:hypothetical protein